ncbi:MAG: hypothetical protein J6B85_03295 [Lachnospiraceae bacterium]|nr:hypothetical protein [Lachnospiraceae bacterium]
MLQKELERRKVPKIAFPADESGRRERREEIKTVLCRELYGFAPDFPLTDESVILRKEENAFGGKAVACEIDVRVRSPFNYASFRAQLVVPKGIKKVPMFLCYTFTPAIADGCGEELIDNGYAIASLYYEGVAPDKPDDHLLGAGRFCRRNPYDSWGKIAIWAWAGSRLLDYILARNQTEAVIDEQRIAVVGHSRLGKTALFAGAMDERYSMVISNDSGAGGIALYRGKRGERLTNLAGKGSRLWFCGNMLNWVDREEELPYDANYLAALIAPRHLYVASATEDDWADPQSEFLSCVAASEAWESYGLTGLVSPDRYPEPNEAFHDGCIGYHLRKGTHYMGRDDWHRFMEYRARHNV